MNWSRGHILGRGSSATVYAATSSDSREMFAVKSAELPQSELLQREQTVLSTISSPWIVGYKGYDVTRENNSLVFNLMLEYMAGGTLRDGIRRHGGKLGESAIVDYTRQILQGLEYLHSRGIVHCDIKSRNVLLSDGGAKIADFGCAKQSGSAAACMGGTPMFMPPETAQGKEQEFPADIWALGCTVIEMATGGGSPWPNATDPASLLYRIANSGESPEIPHSLSDQAKDFLGKCLRQNPGDRWTAEQLLNHPFLLQQARNQNNQIPKESPTDRSSPTRGIRGFGTQWRVRVRYGGVKRDQWRMMIPLQEGSENYVTNHWRSQTGNGTRNLGPQSEEMVVKQRNTETELER